MVQMARFRQPGAAAIAFMNTLAATEPRFSARARIARRPPRWTMRPGPWTRQRWRCSMPPMLAPGPTRKLQPRRPAEHGNPGGAIAITAQIASGGGCGGGPARDPVHAYPG